MSVGFLRLMRPRKAVIILKILDEVAYVIKEDIFNIQLFI